MSELQIPKIEKTDIIAPHLETGTSAIVFQRHERYERDVEAENAGSITEKNETIERDKDFFREILSLDTDGAETMVLFISSDTQYVGKGYRSMETAQLAQDAAVEVMTDMGIDPTERIINLHPSFNTHNFKQTGQSIRPDDKIREPQIFDDKTYVDFMTEKYGEGKGLTPKVWAMHEMDAEKEKREELGAEGVHDIVDRTKKSLKIIERYASRFHSHPENSGKKLVIWVASHYDTISPLVKDATDTGFDQYIPVDYGAGVVIELDKDSEPVMNAQGQKVKLKLGGKALETIS